MAFTSLVDSTGLDDAVKHRYLSGALSGIAASAISGLPLNGDEYGEAMEKLRKRFGRKKVILLKAFAKVSRLSVITKPDEKSLKKFIMDVESAMNAIKGQC